MTDENNPKPTKKTSAIPLRKETVRVTLKSTPDGGNESVNVPAPAPTIPLNAPSGAPSVPAPAPTVKLQTGAPATTTPLRMAPTSKTPEPAPTVKLDTPGTSTPTGASSQPLPKATVELEPAKPFEMDAPMGQYLDVKTDEKSGEAAIVTKSVSTRDDILSIIALVAALVVLGLQLGTSNIWVNDETEQNPGWGRLFE